MENTNSQSVQGTEESMNGVPHGGEQVGTIAENGDLAQCAGQCVCDSPLSKDENLLFGLLREVTGLGDGGDIVVQERIRHLAKHPISGDLDLNVLALPTAAVAYALRPDMPELRKDYWPFSPETYKPSDDRVVELSKAGALILAAIDQINLSKILQKSYNGVNEDKSSQVNFISYNPNRQVLLVTFKGGGSYQYSNVDVPTYIEAYKTDSIGKWINSVLKADTAKYTFTKL